ncbi:hypothetical protein KP05_08810 [Cobetia amphilecti]|nr:hypothetical protein KP05_08810 [Cobetia amphilecti]
MLAIEAGLAGGMMTFIPNHQDSASLTKRLQLPESMMKRVIGHAGAHVVEVPSQGASQHLFKLRSCMLNDRRCRAQVENLIDAAIE